MIDGIRRRFGAPPEKDPWDPELEFEPEVEDASELPTDAVVLIEAARATPGFSPGGGDLVDYYKGIVKTAIANGGKYGDHEISVPWLKMTLAGLENRPIEPEMMWFTDSDGRTPPGGSSYYDLFPTDRGVPAGPG